MNHIIFLILSFCVTINSMHAAACSSGTQFLIPCHEPLPYNEALSDMELLTRPQQYAPDIARMAIVVELFDHVEAERKEKKLCMLPLHMRCMVSHASIGKQLRECSSNLGAFFQGRSESAAHHPAPDVHEAVADLFVQSKALWDATPAEERETWLLRECTQHSCSATRSRYPDTRKQFEQIFAQSVQTKTGNRSVYASIGSGSLAQDVRLLQLLAERGINVDTVVAIDTNYSTLMNQLAKGNEQGAIEVSFDETLHTKIQYPHMCHMYFHHDYDALMQKATKGDPAAFSQQLGIMLGLQASDSAFANTLHSYVASRVIDQFKKAALLVQPRLKRMYVGASVAQYMQDCKTRPELRVDMLNGCDFVHLRSSTSNAQWRKLWDDFHAAQTHCLAPSAVSCALTTMTRTLAGIQVYHEADKKIKQWECLDGVWRELCEGEVNTNVTRDFLYMLTQPGTFIAPKPTASAEKVQPKKVSTPKVAKNPAPRGQQKKRNSRPKGRRR